MKKRWMFLTIVLLVSLAATTTVSASSGAKRPVWEKVFDPVPTLGEDTGTDTAVVFKGKMYYSFWSGESGSQIWMTPDGKHWSLAWMAGDLQESAFVIGFLGVFEEQLYVSMGVLEEEFDRLVIMRTSDGLVWEEVYSFQSSEDFGAWFCAGFTTYQDVLYFGLCTAHEIFDVRLLSSASGDTGTWEQVALFPGWNGISAFATFKEMLYVSSEWTFNPAGEQVPFQVFRSANGRDWEPVTLDGFGDTSNISTGSFGKKDGYLYLGTASLEGGDIWRTQDGMNWQPVSLDGLGNPLNLVFDFASFKGYLLAYSGNLEQGVHVYASQDGLRWKLINEPGWGDAGSSYIWHGHAVVAFKGALYLGLYGPGGVMRLGVQ